MNKKLYYRLLAEMRDDAAQRPLYEKGVRYEDERAAIREILEGTGLDASVDKSIDGQERDGIEI